MAFSKVHEIEIDSRYRLSTSASSTDFEYSFPFTWPYPHEQCQIRLVGAWIPDSFYRFPASNLIGINDLGVTVGTVTGLLIVGNYTPAQIVTLMNSGLATIFGASNVTFQYDGIQQKFSVTNNLATLVTIQSQWFPLMGLGGVSVAVPGGGTSVTFPNVGDLGEHIFNRLYIRLSSFENKIVLPNIYNSATSFAVPLDLKNSRGYWYLDTSSQNKQKLNVLFMSGQLNNNSIIKVQLYRQDGVLLNLNGREWDFSIRIEPLGYIDG
jgi:hypothetical protein